MNRIEKTILKALHSGETYEYHPLKNLWVQAGIITKTKWFRDGVIGITAFESIEIQSIIEKGWVVIINGHLAMTKLGSEILKKNRRKKYGTIPKRIRDEDIG